MGDGHIARVFVDLTVHEARRVGAPANDPRIVAGYTPMRPERKPPPIKSYPGLADRPVPEELSDVLHWSAGVVRTLADTPVGPQLFRAAGSAGNLHPLEVYVIRDGTVAAFDPLHHRLVPVATGVRSGPLTLVISGIPWRTAWKYRERGFRHLYWDCGSMLAQLIELATDARVWLGFDDAAVAEMIGADGVHEVPLALVTLGDGDPVVDAAPGGAVPGTIAADPVEFPLITETQHAGDLVEPDVVTWRENPQPSAAGGPHLPDPVSVIARRGSTRRFRREPGPAGLLEECFEFATAPIAADFLQPGSTLLSHHLALHAVDGVEPGAYGWSGDGFVQLEAGDLRSAAAALCLGQDLAGDACFTVFHSTDLDAVLDRFGDRGYRAALVEAGIVEGRLHLAAFSRGLGATGLTYLDHEVQQFFHTTDTPLLVTAVGVPATRAPRAGSAGAPTEIGGHRFSTRVSTSAR